MTEYDEVKILAHVDRTSCRHGGAAGPGIRARALQGADCILILDGGYSVYYMLECVTPFRDLTHGDGKTSFTCMRMRM